MRGEDVASEIGEVVIALLVSVAPRGRLVLAPDASGLVIEASAPLATWLDVLEFDAVEVTVGANACVAGLPIIEV